MAAQTKTLLGYLIEEYGLTQRKLALGLELNQGKISQWINGKAKQANNREAEALEAFFQLPVEQLLAPMEADHV